MGNRMSKIKRETRKSQNGLAVYDLRFGNHQDIDVNFNSIFDGGKMARREIIETITTAIHGIPKLFEGVELGHLELYLGKTSVDQINTRAQSHSKQKDTHFFIPIIAVRGQEINYIEKLGLKYLFFLQENDHLCFGKLLNERDGGGGRRTDSNLHIIYLTFRIDQRKTSKLFPRKNLDLATGHLYYSLKSEFPNDANPNDLRSVLEVMNCIGKQSKLYWDENSKQHA